MDVLQLAAGTGELTVAARGGRIAGLHPLVDGPNVLWQGDTVAPLSGGDRLWLGPEREVLYDGDPEVRGNWRCPEELDPGTWVAEASNSCVVLHQTALGAGMRRTVLPLAVAPVDTDLAWTGCEVREQVTTDEELAGWHLAMVPTPATLFVRHARDPVAIYRPAPELDGDWVRATGTGEWKLGFPPPPDGRIVLAAVADSDPGGLLVLLTDADPNGTYLDVPPQGGGPATAIQLYDSPHLGFCEIEHHFPLGADEVTTVVFGAFGPRDDRLELLGRLAT